MLRDRERLPGDCGANGSHRGTRSPARPRTRGAVPSWEESDKCGGRARGSLPGQRAAGPARPRPRPLPRGAGPSHGFPLRSRQPCGPAPGPRLGGDRLSNLTRNFPIAGPAGTARGKGDPRAPRTPRAPLGPPEPARGPRAAPHPAPARTGGATATPGKIPPQNPGTGAEGGKWGKQEPGAPTCKLPDGPLPPPPPNGFKSLRAATVSAALQAGAGISALAFPAPSPTPSAAAGGAPLPWRRGDPRQPPSSGAEAGTSALAFPGPGVAKGHGAVAMATVGSPARRFQLGFLPWWLLA